VKKNGRMRLAAACFLIVILSAGCAALSSIAVKQETLEERVKQYMQAQVDGKWDSVYSFFDASSRAKVTRESYINQPRNLPYRGFGIEEIATFPSGDRATVKVKIDIWFMGYDFKGASQTQEWVKERGEWFVKSDLRPQSRNPFTQQEKKQ
jgi:hypothetical protein